MRDGRLFRLVVCLNKEVIKVFQNYVKRVIISISNEELKQLFALSRSSVSEESFQIMNLM